MNNSTNKINKISTKTNIFLSFFHLQPTLYRKKSNRQINQLDFPFEEKQILSLKTYNKPIFQILYDQNMKYVLAV